MLLGPLPAILARLSGGMIQATQEGLLYISTHTAVVKGVSVKGSCWEGGFGMRVIAVPGLLNCSKVIGGELGQALGWVLLSLSPV